MRSPMSGTQALRVKLLLHSCLMLTVTLVLHCGPQPGDALLAAPLPQQYVLSVLVEVNAELARAGAVHVVVEAQTLRPPGAPEWAGQQPDTLTGQHGRRLHVQVVSCQSKVSRSECSRGSLRRRLLLT